MLPGSDTPMPDSVPASYRQPDFRASRSADAARSWGCEVVAIPEQEVVFPNPVSFRSVLVEFMLICKANGGAMNYLPSLVLASFASLALLVSCSSEKEAKDAAEKDAAESVKQPSRKPKPIPIDPLPTCWI